MIGALLFALSLPLPVERGQAALVDRATGTLAATNGAPAAAYSIGSTIKPFTLLAAWRAGVLKETTRVACQGRSGRYRCSHGRLGAVSPAEALEHSCNWFVLTVGRRIPPAVFRATLASMGLPAPPGAALTDEDLLGITVAATPEVLARAYQRWWAADVPEFLRRGIEHGKTGTAGRHAWFAAAAPRYVLTVLIYGGTGARDAAPEAARLIRQLGPVYRVEHRGQLKLLGEDEYINMALSGEAGECREKEYLKALSVLFRTFAQRESGRHRAEGSDFCGTTHCLALRPEHRVFAAPVSASRDHLLAAGDRPAQVFFSANCGGRTEAAETIWPKAKAAHLGGRTDEYCVPEFWERKATLEELSSAFPGFALLRRIDVRTRTSSGRALELEINGSITIGAPQFRINVGRRLGWSVLNSTWFELELQGDAVVFRGRGRGHGVGLCQTGAAAMARGGKTYREILEYYLPGTQIRVNWRSLAERLFPGMRVPEIVEHPTVASFIAATGRAGWSAGATRGGRIHLQPGRLLEKAGILESTLRHELVHAGVSKPAPRWLEEGAAIYFSGEGKEYTVRVELPDAELERRLRAPRSKEELRAAYAAAYWRVRRMIAREGESAVRKALGLPEPQ